MMRNQKGMSLIEVLIALFLCSIVVLAAVTFISTSFGNTKRNKDKDFATQKAIAMMQELKSLIEDQGNDATLLDSYDDGPLKFFGDAAGESPVLTTRVDVTNPLASGSANIAYNSDGSPVDFKYLRHVSVQRLPGAQSSAIRLVNVKVFMNQDTDKDGYPDLLAEVAGVIQTIASAFPPTQVYDVYLLAVENVPGWWVYMSNLIPFVQNAVSDLQARNPGLEFRTHWITKLSYGRDQQYRPYINEAADSQQASSGANVYWYPGRMPTGAVNPSNLNFYYPPSGFNAWVHVDGAERNGYLAPAGGDPGNPWPYTLADQFNHAMRYEDEKNYFDQRVAAGLESDDTPTFRLLMERMYQNPDDYRNAIFINLHGELFPFPPIRNYSDAAKNPEDPNLQNVRVVTHPQKLHYQNTDDMVLRVYSYSMTPPTAYANPKAVGEPGDDYLGQTPGPTPITITIRGLVGGWAPVAGQVRAIRGGFDNTPLPANLPFDAGTERDEYTIGDASAGGPAYTGDMYYTTTTDAAGDTVIQLFNSPLKTPSWTVNDSCDGNTSDGSVLSCVRGLNIANKRLYGLEYIPTPVEDLTLAAAPPTPFVRNLTMLNSGTAGATCTRGDCTKNTARWILTIPSANLPTNTAATDNNLITIETRIGDTTTSGVMFPAPDEPTNLSRTYVYRGTDQWAFGDATMDPHLPLTERFQILGDPRHNPYSDLKMPHQGSGLPNQNQLGMGFNRYFDDFHNAGAGNLATNADYWPGFFYTVGGVQYGVESDGTVDNDGWKTNGGTGNGNIEMDEHRIYQTLRTVLMNIQAIYTTMTGFSYYYTGIGNEIEYDAANGFGSSIPVNRGPFTGVTGSTMFEGSITVNGLPGSNPAPFTACGVKYIRENDAAATTNWWGINWLGELWPDSMYPSTVANGWVNTGNLPTGTASNTFIRMLRANITTTPNTTKYPLPSGTTFLNTTRRPQEEGSTTLFWSGSTNSTFHHQYYDACGTTPCGTVQAAGTEISTAYSYPLASPVPLNRPFNTNVNDAGMNPDHFLQAVYGPANTATQQAAFYNVTGAPAGANQGSSLLSLRNGTTNELAFIVVNGISMTGQSGTAFISRWSLLTLIQSFLQGGLFNVATPASTNPDVNHVQQLPRIEITEPNDSISMPSPTTSVHIEWAPSWHKWDNNPYTTGYAADYTEDASGSPIIFQVIYSDDDGLNWKYMQDDTAAVAGVRSTDTAHWINGAPNALPLNATYTYDWNTGGFAQGNYMIRVEAYRSDFPLHYSFHQYRVFVRN
jgi:prepilin-type N-terminal cleavage/methylation domain-containing protein